MDSSRTPEHAAPLRPESAIKPAGWMSRAQVLEILDQAGLDAVDRQRLEAAFDAWHQRSEQRAQDAQDANTAVQQLLAVLVPFTEGSSPSDCAFWTGDVSFDQRCRSCDHCQALDVRTAVEQRVQHEQS